jgi:hypothetical protein
MKNMTHLLRHWLTPHHSNQHRAKLIQPSGLVLLALLLIGLHIIIAISLRVGPLTSILGYSSDITANTVLSAVNVQRKELGMSELAKNQQLTIAATTKANDMITNQYWSHNTPSGKEPWSFIRQSGYEYSAAGENLARNFSHTDGMVDAWLASPTHRANLLSTRYSETGIAVVNGKLDGVETTLVVQMFGSPTQPTPAQISETAPMVSEIDAAKETDTAVQPGPAAVLGDETQIRVPVFSPKNLYQWGAGGAIIILLTVLLYDSLSHKKKKHTFFGKNLAHIILLVATIATIVLSQSGELL